MNAGLEITARHLLRGEGKVEREFFRVDSRPLLAVHNPPSLPGQEVVEPSFLAEVEQNRVKRVTDVFHEFLVGRGLDRQIEVVADAQPAALILLAQTRHPPREVGVKMDDGGRNLVVSRGESVVLLGVSSTTSYRRTEPSRPPEDRDR